MYNIDMFAQYNRPGAQFKTEQRDKIVEAIQKVVWVLKNYTKPQTVSDGYRNCGQWPLSYDMAMGKCPTYRKLTKKQEDIMKNAVGEMVEIYRERGIVTEEEMDNLHIPQVVGTDRTIPKDQRVLYQQRAVLMSGDECIRQYKARIQRILDEKNMKEQKKQEAAERAEQKKQEAAEKAAERVRVMAEKAAKRDRLKAENAAKKEAEQLQMQRRREEEQAKKAEAAAQRKAAEKKRRLPEDAQQALKQARIQTVEVAQTAPEVRPKQASRTGRVVRVPSKYNSY